MNAVQLAVIVCLSSLACAPNVVGRAPDGAEIVQISLRLSNVFLVKATRPVLIDSGTLGDMKDLEAALDENHVAVRDVALVVVTHAHGDHAGLAADVRRASGAKIFLGAGDVELARRGHDDELMPTSLFARLIKPTIPVIFPEFVPDVAVREPVDLAPWGIDGKVISMPGHTTGSLVVVLSNRSAFVGDEMLGGIFGGSISPHSPGEHYFQADAPQNRRNIATLVRQGIETFYLGHGGPVSRADVIAAFQLDSAGP